MDVSEFCKPSLERFQCYNIKRRIEIRKVLKKDPDPHQNNSASEQFLDEILFNCLVILNESGWGKLCLGTWPFPKSTTPSWKYWPKSRPVR